MSKDFLYVKLSFFIYMYMVSKWSRGMIPALGAGGPEFNPRFGPILFLFEISYLVLRATVLVAYSPEDLNMLKRRTFEGVLWYRDQATGAST